MSLSLGDIVTALGGELHGDVQMRIEAIQPLATATRVAVSFVSHPRYRAQLLTCRAGCVIVGPELREAALARGACIIAEQPYLYFARLTQLWRSRHGLRRPAGVHATAVVDPSAVVDMSAHIGPLCVVEAGACIGAGTVLTARVHVGADCIIGARCLLHPGAVVGADGFGFAPGPVGWEKIEQLGAVRIGDDVEIGANTCIDRGALDDTVLEDGVKLDNLVQIGHNVRVGRHTAMAGCAGIAGSAVIGAHCTIGGGAVVLGHLELADRVHVSAASVVTRSILQPGHYSGFFPIDDNAAWEKNAAVLRRLHALRQRVTTLENTPPHRTPPTP